MSSFDEQYTMICRMQTHRSIAISRLYLTDDQINSIVNCLTHDELPSGSIGRYREVPVYSICEALNEDPKDLRTDEGITYSYIEWNF